MVIAVHVYDGGRRIPPGSNNPTVVDEFMGELSSSELQVKHGGYTHFERPSVPVDLHLWQRLLPLHHLQRRATSRMRGSTPR